MQLSLLAVLLLGLACVNALPDRWYNPPVGPSMLKKRCGTHPSTAIKVHLEPAPDSAIKFSVLAPKSKVQAKFLCPGVTYTVKATWGMIDHSLMTSSVGSWKNGFPGCTGTIMNAVFASPSNNLGGLLTIPCKAKGKATLKLTHSTPFQHYWQSSKGFPINRACAAKACAKSG